VAAEEASSQEGRKQGVSLRETHPDRYLGRTQNCLEREALSNQVITKDKVIS